MSLVREGEGAEEGEREIEQARPNKSCDVRPGPELI